MENASKAVIMAGSVLIAIAIISLALYFYSRMGSYISQEEELYTMSQIESFNRFYQTYPIGVIRGIDAQNLYNKAIDDEVGVNVTLNLTDDHYFDQYTYNIVYDDTGRVVRIVLNKVL